jgi:hypothetical protein
LVQFTCHNLYFGDKLGSQRLGHLTSQWPSWDLEAVLPQVLYFVTFQVLLLISARETPALGRLFVFKSKQQQQQQQKPMLGTGGS